MTSLPFMSTVLGSLDSKGRVCIPASFRQVLAAQNTAGLYVYPAFVDASLEGFGQDAIDGLQKTWTLALPPPAAAARIAELDDYDRCLC